MNKIVFLIFVLVFCSISTAEDIDSACEEVNQISAEPKGSLSAIPDKILADPSVRARLAELNKNVLVYDIDSSVFTYNLFEVQSLSKLEVSLSVLPIASHAKRQTEKFSIIFGEGFGPLACKIERVDLR